MDNNTSLKTIETKVGKVNTNEINSTKLLPNEYLHQYRYWKKIMNKKSDLDVEDMMHKNDLGEIAKICLIPSKQNYERLVRYYVTRNILLERGVLVENQ
jgi:hypothetical protein